MTKQKTPFIEGAVALGRWDDIFSLLRAIHSAVGSVIERHRLVAKDIPAGGDEYREHGALTLSPKAIQEIERLLFLGDDERPELHNHMGLFRYDFLPDEDDLEGPPPDAQSMLAIETAHGDLLIVEGRRMPDAMAGYSLSRETYLGS